jgi:hypothetical protein
MRIAMKFILPLLMFITLGSFSLPARAANDDLLNATLGQAIGQFRSKAEQPGAHAQGLNRRAPNHGKGFMHGKRTRGQQVPAPAAAATPATPASPAIPAVPAIPSLNSAAVPATPATPATPAVSSEGAGRRSGSFGGGTSSLPSIAPAAGVATPAAAPAATAAPANSGGLSKTK